MKEIEYRDKVLAIISPHWEVLGLEVPGIFPQTEKSIRIDAVIKPKDTTLWKNKNVVFGVEFKTPESGGSIGGLTRLIGQALDYTRAFFEPWGYIPVIICPGVKPWFDKKHRKNKPMAKELYHVIARILGKCDIYELRNTTHWGVAIFHNGDHIIWSEKQGVKDGKRMQCKVKFSNTKRGHHAKELDLITQSIYQNEK